MIEVVGALRLEGKIRDGASLRSCIHASSGDEHYVQQQRRAATVLALF